MRLEFAKMHGLGNDFVVVDASRRAFALSAAQISALADRRTGVGFDQLLVVEPASSKAAHLRYRIFNADGGEVEHCGNGARCFARFVRERGIASHQPLVVETQNGLISVEALEDHNYRVDMGVPELEPVRIPLLVSGRCATYSLTIDADDYQFAAVSMGNPHAVLCVENVDTAPVTTLGPRIETHGLFPERVNVGFMQLCARGELRVRVWERGVGETRACGTGACAAVVAARLQDLVDADVQVQLTGGTLLIHWPGEGQRLTMSGPTARVFDGSIEI
ncbi:MAG: diaminopimelate epimerase [Gammaproteobacteria bacterium]|nr:diaminopimelate epimerase [Gammaproteobacteria bacterium]